MRVARSFIVVVALALVAMGLTVLASAGTVPPGRIASPYHFLVRQAVWLVPAIAIFAMAAFVDYRIWLEKRWLIWCAYGVVVLLMLAVFLGTKDKGSHRWISLGPIHVQPGELAKLMTLLTVSYLIVKADWKVGLFWRGVAVIAAITGVFPLLAICEPDFGSTLVMGFTIGAMLFVGGMRLLQLVVLGGVSAIVFLGYLSTNMNRMRRVMAWLPKTVVPYVQGCLPWLDLSVCDDSGNANHQLNQAYIALRHGFASGGVSGAWKGVGFNNSMQKQHYLPENHTDFIFAIGAEEWGLAFSLLTLLLFTVLFAFGLYIAWRCRDRFGRLLAFGVSFLLFSQALFNIGVVTGLLPTKGLALPFMSYGGTNLVSTLAAVGVLYGVARRTDLKDEAEKSTISRVFYH